MEDEILAVANASPTRRWLGIGMLGGIGFLVIYVAFSTPPEFGWQMFLLAIGGLALWMADKMRRATTVQIELTETELRDSTGVVIARVADIQRIDRGAFAFKPSNGFLIRTGTPGGRVWLPGVWWRIGRRIGIGGVMPGSQTRFMAETLSAMIAMRDQPTDPSIS